MVIGGIMANASIGFTAATMGFMAAGATADIAP
jgi:hypothetical protein